MKKFKMFKDFILSYLIDDYYYDYWHCPHPHSDFIKSEDYIINFQYKTNYPGPFDGKGIPLLDLQTQHWTRKSEIVYAPIIICQFGLGWYSHYLRTKERNSIDKFLNIANWLIRNSVKYETNNTESYILYSDYGDGKVISGMAQGLAISIWCRAYSITRDLDYLNYAFKAFNIFKISIEDGGIVDNVDDCLILEEWANERIHILNGHIFAFIGILDLLKFEKEIHSQIDLRKYYNLHLNGTKKLLEKADLKFWSKYSFRKSFIPNICSLFYQKLHVELLHGLFIETGDLVFKSYSEKFQKQLANYFFRTVALILKIIDRIYINISIGISN